MTRTRGPRECAAPLALTMGDPAGISGEIAVAAWTALAAAGGPAFFAIDDPDRLSALGAPVRVIDAPDAALSAFTDALPVLPEPLDGDVALGRPDPRHAAPQIRSIARAVALARAGDAAGVVTNPINKAALKTGADFPYPGHTEYLAALCGAERSVMMLASPALRVVPVTIHVSLADAIATLTGPLIEATARIVHASLRTDFALAAPRLVFSGLNPHAGEQGLMGREEIDVIVPAIERLRREGLDIQGPAPADSLFHEAARSRYDAALCMTHDQALIPIKTLDFDRAVNVTLGLPIVRTSPDHGVAYDIAGQARARPDSLIAALRLAAEMAEARAVS